jgi:predicted acetyltransferase
MADLPFVHLDAGPLVDAELELVEPAREWIDAHMAALQHPLTQELFPEQARVTRSQLMEMVSHAPRGQYHGNAVRGVLPAYTFWMRLVPTPARPKAPLEMAGSISLRIANTEDIEMYLGHIGYHVYPPARGFRYAERAVRLLLPLARMHGINPVWITCNPDNTASRKTCERVGGRMIDIVPIPENHPFHSRGERYKCRYRIDFRRETA